MLRKSRNLRHREYQNKVDFNNKTLMAYAVVFSGLNGVKPMVCDNLYRAIEDLSNGDNVEAVTKKFQKNINEDMRFQFVLDTLKPVYESFVSHIDDTNYQFMSYYLDDDEAIYIYTDEIHAEEIKIEKSIIKCQNELKLALLNSGLIDKNIVITERRKSKYFHSKEMLDVVEVLDKNIDRYLNSFVERFFETQTRAFDMYDLSKYVFENIKNDEVFSSIPVFTANHDTRVAIENLNKIVGSTYINMLTKQSDFSRISNESKKKFVALTEAFVQSKGLHIPMFEMENKSNYFVPRKMLEVLSEEGSIFDELRNFDFGGLSNPAKTLYFERVLQMKYLQKRTVGTKSSPLKITLEKDENGNMVRKSLFEEGDLLHLAEVKDGHLENIFGVNCLVPQSLLKNFFNKRAGDACYGGLHLLENPVEYNDFKIDYPEGSGQLYYFKNAAYDTYNQYGDRAGFVIDKRAKLDNAQFDLMHAMDSLMVNERMNEIFDISSAHSANYYSHVGATVFERKRLIHDRCYLLGMPLSYLKAINLFDGRWRDINNQTLEKVCDFVGDAIPVVVNGVVVNNPTSTMIEVVDSASREKKDTKNSESGSISNANIIEK